MTKKQKQFIEEYLVDLNATQAAIRAGYSPDTAYCNQRAPTDGFAEQNGRDAERADLTCSY